MRKADEVYSKYIRQKDAKNGVAQCITCGKWDDWKNLHCGHFIGRQHKSTRYYEKNTHVQCPGCNSFREGEKDVYALYLVQKYGPNILEELNIKKNTITRMGEFEFKIIIEEYKTKLKEL